MKLAADANVLLSAVLGGRARLILTHSDVEAVLTTEKVFSEVEEYATLLAHKRHLALDTLLLAVATLPISVLMQENYAGSLPRARKLIGKRDPDDAEILALALHLKLPLWSNDNDFEGTGVEWYTTAELLSKLRIFDRR